MTTMTVDYASGAQSGQYTEGCPGFVANTQQLSFDINFATADGAAVGAEPVKGGWRYYYTARIFQI